MSLAQQHSTVLTVPSDGYTARIGTLNDGTPAVVITPDGGQSFALTAPNLALSLARDLLEALDRLTGLPYVDTPNR